MTYLGLEWRISQLIEYLSFFDHSDPEKEYLYRGALREYNKLVEEYNVQKTVSD